MISPLIFSKDRPAQLDLLLRSLEVNGGGLCDPAAILFRASNIQLAKGYGVCIEQHPEARFFAEIGSFEAQSRRLIATIGAGGHFMALCDDDVLYLDAATMSPTPTEILDAHEDVLCFSLRLGLNASRCYSLNCDQSTWVTPPEPFGHALIWDWRNQVADRAYPGSLDGHVFRTADVLAMLHGRTWANPNSLEERLMAGCQALAVERPRMASWFHSVLIGMPINSVSGTHGSNRFGERFPQETETLNAAYLGGGRLSLDTVRASEVNAAHREFEFVWLKSESFV